jgi:hypothetical protein
MAEKPHNAAIRARQLEWADKDEALAQAAEARIHQKQPDVRRYA